MVKQAHDQKKMISGHHRVLVERTGSRRGIKGTTPGSDFKAMVGCDIDNTFLEEITNIQDLIYQGVNDANHRRVAAQRLHHIRFGNR